MSSGTNHYRIATFRGQEEWMTRYFWGQDENSWTNPVASTPDGWDIGSSTENNTGQQGVQAQLTTLLGGYTDYQ